MLKRKKKVWKYVSIDQSDRLIPICSNFERNGNSNNVQLNMQIFLLWILCFSFYEYELDYFTSDYVLQQRIMLHTSTVNISHAYKGLFIYPTL